jgi:UPF0716 protein FxsA
MFLRLLLLFTVVPLVELYLLVEIGSLIGVAPTIAIVIITGFFGAWLARRQGMNVLKRLNEELAAGGIPTEALTDGLLILIAGAVLLTPGLLTDAFGFFLLVPGGRALIRKSVSRAFARRIHVEQPDVIDAEWYREE